MVAGLVLLKEQSGFQLQTVDVDADPALTAHYGGKVPVLVGEEGEICHYFLDRAALERYLSGD